MKRGNLALEDGKWQEADSFFESVLNIDAEEARAYLGKLMSKYNIRMDVDFESFIGKLDISDLYNKCYRFGNDNIKQMLQKYNFIGYYNLACRFMDMGNTSDEFIDEIIRYYKNAIENFKKISGYGDADIKCEECNDKIKKILEDNYQNACNLLDNASSIEDCINAKKIFDAIQEYKDSKNKILDCESVKEKFNEYLKCVKEMESVNTISELHNLADKFKKLDNFCNAPQMFKKCCILAEQIDNQEKERIYVDACQMASKGDEESLKHAIDKFNTIKNYKDSFVRIKDCNDLIKLQIYNTAINYAETNSTDKENVAIELFHNIYTYKDSAKQIKKIEKRRRFKMVKKSIFICLILILIFMGIRQFFLNIYFADLYDRAQYYFDEGYYDDAAYTFDKINGYKNSAEMYELATNIQEITEVCGRYFYNDDEYSDDYIDIYHETWYDDEFFVESNIYGGINSGSGYKCAGIDEVYSREISELGTIYFRFEEEKFIININGKQKIYYKADK